MRLIKLIFTQINVKSITSVSLWQSIQSSFCDRIVLIFPGYTSRGLLCAVRLTSLLKKPRGWNLSGVITVGRRSLHCRLNSVDKHKRYVYHHMLSFLEKSFLFFFWCKQILGKTCLKVRKGKERRIPTRVSSRERIKSLATVGSGPKKHFHQDMLSLHMIPVAFSFLKKIKKSDL